VTGKIEVIEWVDPCQVNAQWLGKEQFLSFAQHGGHLTTSVGFVMYEDEECVVMVQSISNDGELVSEAQKILKANIKRRTRIGLFETLVHYEAWAGDNAPKWDGAEFNESGAPMEKFG